MPRRNRVQNEKYDKELTGNDSAPEHTEDEKDGKVVATTKLGASRKKTKVKHERRTTTGHQKFQDATDNADAEAEDDALIPFDKDEFLATARPISREQVEFITCVMRDLQHLTTQIEHVGFDLVTDTAMAIGEVSGDMKDGEELDFLMRNLIDAQEEIKAHEQSLNDLKQRILRGEVVDNLTDAYITKATDLKEMYLRKTTRQKYARHDKYFSFKEQVWEVNHQDAMPPLKDLLPREDNDSEDDSDIEVGGKTQDYKCPLTLRIMENPVTSPCGHSFSMEGIKEYLQNGSMVCPATGCEQRVVMNDFKYNEQLARRIADRIRRDRRREDESDQENTEVVD